MTHSQMEHDVSFYFAEKNDHGKQKHSQMEHDISFILPGKITEVTRHTLRKSITFHLYWQAEYMSLTRVI